MRTGQGYHNNNKLFWNDSFVIIILFQTYRLDELRQNADTFPRSNEIHLVLNEGRNPGIGRIKYIIPKRINNMCC
jgi:hypothetical protein